ncbi:hypothetical protein BUALT_Bualt04G0133500 [Buddleja alternifolia]|uniref:Protein kinase domain-containing protein n=1 Tax=Buddleja alternifolia TaxID=168488 RepID=A0AAV6XQ11_9LAMI|nr:hypothetical protein BUALT_Bualt04G0133500 [Buddleja alternifolia]
MHSSALYLVIILLHIFPTIPTAAATPAYTATDFILLNCGASSNLNDTSTRSWDTDERSRYAPSNAAAISTASKATNQHPSVRQVPYETARVFTSPFTYTFPVLAGPKFVRLYFYPDIYSNFSTTLSYFSVTANGYTLLSNFSAFLNSPSPSNPSFMKEFIINVDDDQRLDLTFTPNTNSSAFINGIEIVSIPDKLYFRGNDVGIKFASQMFYLTNDTALENLYRLNVGGSNVEIQDDSGPIRGMFRAWYQDDDYIYGPDVSYTPHAEDVQINYTAETPPYSAPEIVYKTSRGMGNESTSLDWRFSVDSGFYYLLRLHFCEILLEITKQNQRVFDIYINNLTAEIQADVIYWTGGPEIPIYKDYIAHLPNDGRRGKKDLRLYLRPNLEGLPMYTNAMLNGLEIFKLSDLNRSLAAANPEPVITSSPTAVAVKKKKSSVIYAVVGSVIGALAVVAAVSFLIFRRRQRRVKDSATTDGTRTSAAKSSWVPLSTRSSNSRTSGSGVSLPSDLCRHFLLEEIISATGNFDANFVIGKGGFGNVYKGIIHDGSISTTVAIKRLNPLSNQGAREFLTEIEMLSKLRHLHLVSLIGYCDENGEMILVYDYMAHGTLRDHLYNSDNTPLPWNQRLRICIGASKGLHYLHSGAKYTIIHRDVKSTNILLDEKWVAKVSDFGLSKVGPTGGAHTHVTTLVKGSFGYVDPEYYKRQQLTDKSDVYSFGVVLFEVLCARPAIIPSLPREQVNLAEWAKSCYRKGTIEQIIDSNLDGQIAPECLSKFVETAIMCLGEKGIERPTMSDVVWSLEFAMELQETYENRGGNVETDGREAFVAVSPSFPLLGHGETKTMDNEEMFSGSSGTESRSKSSGFSTSSSEKLKSGDVFSELMNPLGR